MGMKGWGCGEGGIKEANHVCFWEFVYGLFVVGSEMVMRDRIGLCLCDGCPLVW